MELIEGIKSRRAIRKFKPDPVSSDLIKEVLDMARWSPVADFLRTYRYVVVSDAEKRGRIARLISQNTVHLRDLLETVDEPDRQKALDFYPDLGGAPVFLIITIPDDIDDWGRKMLAVSQGTEIQNILLGAFEKGLGACPFSMAPWVEEEIKSELGLEGQDVLVGIAIGWPGEHPAPGPHKQVPTTFI